MVFDREEEWLLVQSKKEGGKAGFVPGNYVEEVYICINHVGSYSSCTQTTGMENTLAPASAAPQIVVPPSVCHRVYELRMFTDRFLLLSLNLQLAP